ncbi:MAG: hypothetical protein ACXVLM_00110 [Ilumatobacteraceae bacterium]
MVMMSDGLVRVKRDAGLVASATGWPHAQDATTMFETIDTEMEVKKVHRLRAFRLVAMDIVCERGRTAFSQRGPGTKPSEVAADHN